MFGTDNPIIISTGFSTTYHAAGAVEFTDGSRTVVEEEGLAAAALLPGPQAAAGEQVVRAEAGRAWLVKAIKLRIIRKN